MLRCRIALQCFCSGSGIAGPDYGSGIRSDDTGVVGVLSPNLVAIDIVGAVGIEKRCYGCFFVKGQKEIFSIISMNGLVFVSPC